MPLHFHLQQTHPSWQPLLHTALAAMAPNYLAWLTQETHWLPGPKAIFNAFSLPLENTHAILFGESPYPRADSANGYAFWDARVHTLWSNTGFDVRVNRATSLRNLLKTMLVANGALSPATLSQSAIAQLDKTPYVKTGEDLFLNFMRQGILLLNASLVLSAHKVKEEAKHWQPFIMTLLSCLQQQQKKITLILFGKIAETILAMPPASYFPHIKTEHPYNLSFITNPTAIQLFKKWDLLSLHSEKKYR